MKGCILPPVAVGGIGGSGTRVVAAFFHLLGYYLGDDLNESMDNLWFTLLFKRRSTLLEDISDLRSLLSLFFFRMSGRTTLFAEERAYILGLADYDRLQHPRHWLLKRAYSFCDNYSSKLANQPWGWKEPNTHIVIDRILELHPDLRYIHVFRHPLDMAVSPNQNQLQNWGPIFLNRDVTIEPRLSLAYWCATHRRIAKFTRRWPDRIMTIDFDALCVSPDLYCANLANFLEVEVSADVLSSFCNFVIRPKSTGRFRNIQLQQFDPLDLQYLATIGYPLS
jgi:hypothetical protein